MRHRSGEVPDAGGSDPGCELRAGPGRAVVRTRGTVGQPLLGSLSLEAADPLVDRLPADPDLLGDLTRLVTGKNSLSDQVPAVFVQASVSVRHRGPPG